MSADVLHTQSTIALEQQSTNHEPAPVGPTALSSCHGLRRVGHIGQRNQRRRVGPQQVAQIELRRSVEGTGAPKPPATAEGDESFTAR